MEKGTIIGIDTTTGRQVAIPRKARSQGVALIGQTGAGKSTLAEGIFLSDIAQGLGGVLIDPHGDSAMRVLSLLPQERVKDVRLIDMASERESVGLNPFECTDLNSEAALARSAAFLMHTFSAIWSVGPETPQLMQVLRHITRACIEAQATLDMVIPLLREDALRSRILARVRARQTREFFAAYGLLSRRDRELLISSTVNKLDALLAEPLIARILCQRRSTLDVRHAIDEGRILLIVLPPTLEEPARLLGSLLIGRILLTTLSRPAGERRPFALYCDEFSRFASYDFATILAEMRKFALFITIAFQALAQVDHVLQASVQATGTLIVFRVNGEDAGVLGKNFNTKPTPGEIIGYDPVRAPALSVLDYLLRHSHQSPEVATFVSDYLLPLDALIHKVGLSQFALEFGCAIVLPGDLREAMRALNEPFAEANRTGRAPGVVSPFALFILGGASNRRITHVFYRHFRPADFNPFDLSVSVNFQGLRESANYLGRSSFLHNEAQAFERLTRDATHGLFERLFRKEEVAERASACLRMLKSLWGALRARSPADSRGHRPVYAQASAAHLR